MAETIEELKKKIALYEQNGSAKLFYALNRKAAEMADILNSTNLKHMDLADAKDKTFERLKSIWSDASSIASAVKSLSETVGITNDEEKDTQATKFKITTPESISDVLGNTAGQLS